MALMESYDLVAEGTAALMVGTPKGCCSCKKGTWDVAELEVVIEEVGRDEGEGDEEEHEGRVEASKQEARWALHCDSEVGREWTCSIQTRAGGKT